MQLAARTHYPRLMVLHVLLLLLVLRLHESMPLLLLLLLLPLLLLVLKTRNAIWLDLMPAVRTCNYGDYITCVC
jgi:hypothetical protein